MFRLVARLVSWSPWVSVGGSRNARWKQLLPWSPGVVGRRPLLGACGGGEVSEFGALGPFGVLLPFLVL